ncbi:aldo/keto reductase [Kibdelosporangium persicum]|uniref:Voltage-dependent potassium channel beta subunit n=1 Tax=Kibdelosporangium persicum TaxID=2698649 RepID=A0ABX2FGZ8_9PSEU|nr:aldo/keto reductase [Kibdelosporangium persicum]NRN70647.1 Voltage-dependent potassium channel beta subunit [Kibdelosporangium persicum]
MEYRRLGRAGLKLSVLSYGTWVTFSDQMDSAAARECLEVARQAGVNFFDSAEVYGNGRSESVLGAAIEDLGWSRETYVLSTKLYWGIHDEVNLRRTLNRKYLLHAIDGCLTRLRTGFVDLLFCHRPDPDTTVEEIVWTMSDIIGAGKALYWGTSKWSASEVRAAWSIADRYGLRKPVVEQPEYNLFTTRWVDEEYHALVSELGIGLTTWSPLASGMLTGKYRDGVSSRSRAALAGHESFLGKLTDGDSARQVDELSVVAADLGCTTAQLAIAWCAANKTVSTVITGASDPLQLRQNLDAVAVVPLLSEEVMARISRIFRHRQS